MQSINDAPLDKTIFDSSIYNLDDHPDIPVYRNEKNEKERMIDFTVMAQQINDITSKRAKSTHKRRNRHIYWNRKGSLRMSISTSNYGGYYILVDSRMPDSIFVVFRGTYSAKSAGSYTKPSSLIPT